MLLINPYRFAAPRFISNDADVVSYVLAVESADGQQLESGVISAYDSFITGCKTDGIWTAIKASCILAGARTLSGALVPLVGAAPTNSNFVTGDYNRETGLLGNGSTKFINANRNHTADNPEQHLFAYITSAHSGASGRYTINSGANSYLFNTATTAYHRAYGASSTQSATYAQTVGGYAVSRFNSTQVSRLLNNVVSTGSAAYQTPTSGVISIFGPSGIYCANGRISFYSIGANLNLSLLNTRVSTLMTDLAAAI